MTQKLLLIGDHFISPETMRGKLGALENQFAIIEAMTPFPLEPFRDIADVREASGSEQEMIELLQGVSIGIAHHAPLTRRIIESAPDLRLFIVCRGGPVNVNLAAAAEHGIVVGYTPARNAAATAEHTVAMLLSALRGIPAADAAIREGRWNGNYTYATAPFELESATVGLIGYGAIGRIVARILRGFGARVVIYDPFASISADEQVQQMSLDDLLGCANVVSLHARETEASRGILGREQIARMQRGSVVVNCARGSLMDYGAVDNALRSGHLFAAAADVFPQEPLPADAPWLALPNFICTPHLAGGTRQAAEKAATIAAEELALYLQAKPMRYVAR